MRTDNKMMIGGLLMGILGAIIAIEFLAVDAQLFGVSPPPWIQSLSNMIQLSGLDLDILITIDLIILLLEFKWQGETKGGNRL